MSIMVIVVTAMSSTSTSRGKTKKSLGRVHLPKELADDLWLWKQECPDSQREAFIFPDAKGGFMDTGNYRRRVLEAFMRWGLYSLKAIGDRMSRFQQGSLFKLERKSRPDVWVFRWYEST